MNAARSSDAALVGRIRRGDAGAFDTLVRRYQRPVLAVAWEYTQSLDDAEDIAQDAFHRVIENIDAFDESKPFRPWLFTIVRNLGRNVAARERRWSKVSVPHDLAVDAVSPNDDVERLAIVGDIETSLSGLSTMQLTCFRLVEMEGFTSVEVGEMLDLSAATVRTHVHRAKATLREKLRAFKDE